MDGPATLTILSTYRCTAACRECCFESSPRVRGFIPAERILQYIDEAARTFPSLRMVVFSGGECFLLGKKLDAAIAQAHTHGLSVRCVTNGYWAITPERARKRILELKEVGLTELNFSTGDEHQAFVPYKRIVNGAIEAAEQDIRALIVIEGCEEARFTYKDAMSDERLATFIAHDARAKNLSVMNNVWMPFHTDHAVTQSEDTRKRLFNVRDGGCQNIFHTIVVTPHEQLAACCGLTMEHIPELKLGSLREHSMGELYQNQFDDFLKIWIALDGPHAIWNWAHEKDSTIQINDGAVHICHACAIIHQNSKVRAVLEKHYREKVPDVMFRFSLKSRIEHKASQVFESDAQIGFAA
jgi:MoaA/NifB/PqqE/SkfB family radical SAM enzyme